jgi:hypothetical protein
MRLTASHNRPRVHGDFSGTEILIITWGWLGGVTVVLAVSLALRCFG